MSTLFSESLNMSEDGRGNRVFELSFAKPGGRGRGGGSGGEIVKNGGIPSNNMYGGGGGHNSGGVRKVLPKVSVQ